MTPRTSNLICFDFDHTLVDANTDVWVYGIPPVCGSLPASIKGSYEEGRWLTYMGRIFTHLASCGVTREALQAHMAAIPWTPGMSSLVSHLHASERTACAILSDSNTLFIDWILGSAGFQEVFTRVLTNPAQWSEVAAAGVSQDEGGSPGVLTVKPFHTHTCSRCNHNLCKREALLHLIAQHRAAHIQQCQDPSPVLNADQIHEGGGQQHQESPPPAPAGVSSTSGTPASPPPHSSSSLRVIYVGDGRNDLCAALALGPQDVVMCRSGFPLDKILADARPADCPISSGNTDVVNAKEHAGGPSGVGATKTLQHVAAGVTAEVVRWSSGEDIWTWLEQQGGC